MSSPAVKDNGRCPHCNDRVLQGSGDSTRLRIRGALTFDAEGRGRAQCWWCKNTITLPLQLVFPDNQVPRERFTVRLTPSGLPDTS